jgi:hypothetical protein
MSPRSASPLPWASETHTGGMGAGDIEPRGIPPIQAGRLQIVWGFSKTSQKCGRRSHRVLVRPSGAGADPPPTQNSRRRVSSVTNTVLVELPEVLSRPHLSKTATRTLSETVGLGGVEVPETQTALRPPDGWRGESSPSPKVSGSKSAKVPPDPLQNLLRREIFGALGQGAGDRGGPPHTS